jgi:hypothetical protein
MNFFFGIKNSLLSCNLTIPKFQNFGKISNCCNLYEAYPENNLWSINKIECEQDKSFFFLNNEILDNKKIFFLAEKNEAKYLKNNNVHLLNINKFTNTKPSAFRSNLKIFIPEKGFSSYQSEYPFDMTQRNGSISSPINMLLNKEADYNFIFFKNIFYKPQHDRSKLYFIDLKKKEIIKEVEIKENYLNEIKVNKEQIMENVYIYTEKCLGIPLYVSVKNSHISFEHTHPPHHYILSEDRFKTVTRIKNELKNIIN